ERVQVLGRYRAARRSQARVAEGDLQLGLLPLPGLPEGLHGFLALTIAVLLAGQHTHGLVQLLVQLLDFGGECLPAGAGLTVELAGLANQLGVPPIALLVVLRAGGRRLEGLLPIRPPRRLVPPPRPPPS